MYYKSNTLLIDTHSKGIAKACYLNLVLVSSLNSTEFIPNKLWFDLQSTIHGFKSVVNIRLSKFPNCAVKAWVVNQDGVENHLCQTRSRSGQNNNRTYRL